MRSLLLWLPLALGLIAGSVVLDWGAQSTQKGPSAEDFGLGKGTTSHFGSDGGHQVHCQNMSDVEACIEGFKARRNQPLALWLGNSQLHGINQYEEGQQTAALSLHKKLAEESRYLMALSQPNANLQEHYVLFEYLSARLPVKTLILPVVFDDLRETGIRETVERAFADPVAAGRLRDEPIGASLIAAYESATGGVEPGEFAALRDTVQDHSERFLNDKLTSLSQVWASRPRLRSNLFMNLYLLRNQAFGIQASSIRKIRKGSYDLNRSALEAIFKSASARGISVIPYIAPLRDDVAPPYDLGQYRGFITDVSNLARDYGFELRDLENIVPPELWGSKASTNLDGGLEVDFMHFQAQGHNLLAKHIYRNFQMTLEGKRNADDI